MSDKRPLIDQPTAMPTRKMKIVGISGSFIPFVTATIAWLIMQVLPGLSESTTQELAAAIAVLVAGLAQGVITFINGYLARERG